MNDIRKYVPIIFTVLISMLIVVCIISLQQPVDSGESVWTSLIKGSDEETSEKGYDIVYVIDNSRSMLFSDSEGIGKQAFEQITSLAMGHDVRIGVVFFGRDVVASQELTHIDSEENAKQITDFISSYLTKNNIGSSTNIAAGLELALEMLLGKETGRERRIILFSDGLIEGDSSRVEKEYIVRLNNALEEIEHREIKLYGLFSNNKKSPIDPNNIFANFEKIFGEENHLINISNATTEECLATIINQFFQVLVDKTDRIPLDSLRIETDDEDDMLDTMGIFVPECGITRMELFIEDIDPRMIELSSQGCSKSSVNPTEDTVLYSYDDPTSGPWVINLKDESYGKIGKCTVSFIAELSSRIELIQKQDLYYITFHFYDSEGNELSLDDEILTTAQIVNESGGIIPIPNIRMQHGEMRSGGFQISEAFEENSRIDFSLEYLNYFKKSYSVSVPVRNYSVTGIENKKYYGVQAENGIAISILLKDISDSGEKLKTIKLTENDAYNILSVSILDQNIILNIPHKGIFKCEVFIGDSTGMESVILLEGTALTRKSIIVTVIVILLTMFILIGTIMTMQHSQRLDEK